jgi:hypothetical protein
VQTLWESAVHLEKSPENYKHTQGHLNKGDAPLLRKTTVESTSHILGIGQQEIPAAGRKEYLLASCKSYLHWMLLVSSVMPQRRSMKIKQTLQLFSFFYHSSTCGLSKTTLTDIDTMMLFS